MNINYSDLVNQKVNLSQSTNAAMLTFREYADSLLGHLTEWTARAEEEDSYDERLAIFLNTVKGKVMCYVQPEQYKAAMNDTLQIVECTIAGTNEQVNIASDELLGEIESVVSEVTTQKEFLEYCINNDNVTQEGIIARIRNKLGDVNSQVLSFCEANITPGDPIQSLKNMFHTSGYYEVEEVEEGSNVYLRIVDKSDYTGASPWAIALAKVWKVVTTPFTLLFKGVIGIGGLIIQLAKGIWTLTKNLVRLIARPLFSRYEKTSSSIGLVDIPMFQLHLADYDANTDHFTPKIDTFDLQSFVQQGLASNYCIVNTKMTLSDLGYVDPDAMIETIFRKCIEVSDGGANIIHPYDLIFAGNLYEFVLRFGIDETGACWLMLYPIIKWSDIKNLTDKQVATIMITGLSEFIEDIAKATPILPWNYSYYGYSNDKQALNEFYVKGLFIDWSKYENLPDDNCDLVSIFKLFNSDDTTYTFINAFANLMIWFGILPYSISHSDLFNDLYDRVNQSIAITRQTCLCFQDIYTVNRNIPDDGGLPEYQRTNSIYFDLMDHSAYFPYLQYNLVGAAVHYQNLDEASREIAIAVVAVAVAAAAITFAIKFAKFKKRRMAMAEIRQGYVDNMSWNMSQNPTKEELRTYNKAKRVARKTNKLNQLLGLSTGTNERSSLMDRISAVQDQLIGLTGVDQEAIETEEPIQSVTLLDIKQLIKR